MYSALAKHWTLDPAMTFLNHGSFGACPRAILELQRRLRDRLESEPVRFMARELEDLLDASRTALADLIHADPASVVFVHNATDGVNAVLRSMHFRSGDELLVTNHAYGACRNAMDFVAREAGARVVAAEVPFPLRAADEVMEAVLGKATPRTRLAMLDHVTSPTGIVFPIRQLVQALGEKGVDTLVDGAHGPGMLPLDMGEIGAAYYTGNCHKWLCAPKGAGFVYVRSDKASEIHPSCISHGYSSPRAGRSVLHTNFDWVGTIDPTSWLCVGECVRWCDSLMPGGIAALMRHNHDLALRGRRILCEALGVEEPCPADLIGSLAAVPIPAGAKMPFAEKEDFPRDPMHDLLFEEYRIEIPVGFWPAPPQRLVRISAQAYNTEEQYKRLAEALREILARGTA
jgi:isopenicillin-N epimerase